MAGHGEHPVADTHCDAATLTAYALGQLSPDAARSVTRHLARCADCRAAVASTSELARSLEHELHHTLDVQHPGPTLSFDRIADQWSRRRTPLARRLNQIASGLFSSLGPLVVVVAIALQMRLGDARPAHPFAPRWSATGPPAIATVMPEEGAEFVEQHARRPRSASPSSYIRHAVGLGFAPEGRWRY